MNFKALVIGYGNTLRSDDGFGCYTAEELERRGGLGGVEILVLQQLTPELADALQDFDLAVFVDADFGAGAGEIVRQRVEAQGTSSSALSHHLTPAALLAMCEALYGRAPTGYLFSVGAGSFEMGESLSPAVQAALLPVVEEIEALVLSKVQGGKV